MPTLSPPPPPPPPPYDTPETLDLDHLHECFAHSLSSTPDLRRRADVNLAQASAHPNFAFSLLRLVSTTAVPGASLFDDKVRVAAAVMLTNHIRSRGGVPTVTGWENEVLKTLLLSLLLSVYSNSYGPAALRLHLEDSLAAICAGDSPESWHRPLLELVLKLRWEAPYASPIAAVFGVANSVIGKLRKSRWDWELIRDLRRCVDDEYIGHVLNIFFLTARSIDGLIASSPARSTVHLLRFVEYQMICYRIFRYLNAQLRSPRSFRLLHRGDWINHTQNYLNLKHLKKVLDLEDGCLDLIVPIDELRSLICENIIFCADSGPPYPWKALFLLKMGDPVIALLETSSILADSCTSSSSSHRLIAVAMNSLIKILGLRTANKFELGEDARDGILRNVVIPNMLMREEEEVLFEADCVEFIRRRDETKRTLACKLLGVLVNGSCGNDIVERAMSEIDQLLMSFKENPAVNWKNKVCAMHLVSVLRKMRNDFDVVSFFELAVVSELQRQDTDGFPVLRAGALKFFAVFCNCLPESVAIAMMPHVVDSLVAECSVVRSYAAICIEFLILLAMTLEIRPFVRKITDNLYSTLNSPGFEENPFIINCIERVIGLSNIPGEIIEPFHAHFFEKI